MTNSPVERWTLGHCREWIAVPVAADDKYSRGVLGMATGSHLYPGAAVLGVEAAVRTGVGMVRYVGDDVPAHLVLQRRPEVVTAPGRVQAWAIGSGMDAAHRDAADDGRVRAALADGVPVVIDAGALDLIGEAIGPGVITPHYRELSRVLADHDVSADPRTIAQDAPTWAAEAARLTGVTVLLKGHVTVVATPSGELLDVSTGPEAGWLATAGSGDVLAGILGALVATHADVVSRRGHDALARLAATAAALHGAAAVIAGGADDRPPGGPFAALDLAEALPAVIRDLL